MQHAPGGDCPQVLSTPSSSPLCPPPALTHLLPALLLPLVFRRLQHLLLPQVEEVGGVGVELEAVLLVIPGGWEGRREGYQPQERTPLFPSPRALVQS